MKVTIQSADELGLVLRAVRKDSGVPLEDLAQTVGVSRQTATNVEQGRTKVSTMIAFLREMGIVVSVEIPQPVRVCVSVCLRPKRRRTQSQQTPNDCAQALCLHRHPAGRKSERDGQHLAVRL